MKKYSAIAILCILVSCMEITISNHELYIRNRTGKDITVFYELSRDKESVEMQVADGKSFRIEIVFQGDQPAYSEDELDLVFEKISFYDGIDTVLVDLEKTNWRKIRSSADAHDRTHTYSLDLTK